MRTVREVARLSREAASIWVRYGTRLGFWFLVGFTLHLLGNLVSVGIGSRQTVVATLVFVLGLIASVAATVAMLHSCEPGLAALDRVGSGGDDGSGAVPAQVFRRERLVDALVVTIGPFLAVYSVWGLVDDEVSNLFVINVALKGLGGVDDFSVNLQWVTLYVVLALVAWALRQVVGRLARRSGRRGWLWSDVVLDGLWVVSSFLALFALGRQLLDWLQGRAVWQAGRSAWLAFLEALPDWQLPFSLTLPDLVETAIGWVWSILLPGLAHAVLLPLVWIALAATVYGWREFSGREIVAGTALERPRARWQRAVERRSGSAGWTLAARVGGMLTGDLQTKYLPVLSAFRLVLRAGPAFLGAYLVLATLVTTVERLGYGLADRVQGPQPQADLLAHWAFVDLVVTGITTTWAVALYAAAFDRVVTVSVGSPPPAARSAAAA